MSEFVAQEPLRRYGLALVTPSWGVDVAVAEIEWAKNNGLRGIMIPHMFTGQDPYHHPKYDPIWRACEEAKGWRASSAHDQKSQGATVPHAGRL